MKNKNQAGQESIILAEGAILIENPTLEMNEAFVRASKKFTKPEFNKSVQYKGVKFEYATLSKIQDCIMSALLEEGFYPVHEIYEEGGVQWVKTYLRYRNNLTLGNVVLPIAITGKSMQEIGSQITYIKRYSLAIVANICADSDNDGQEMVGEKIIKLISNQEAHAIKEMIGNDAASWKMLAKEYGFTKITDITTNKYSEIMSALKLLKAKYSLDLAKEKNNETV